MGHLGIFDSQLQSHNFVVGEVVFGEYGMCFNESGKFAVERIRDNGYLDLVEVDGRHRRNTFVSPRMRGISRKFGIGTYYEDREAPQVLSAEVMLKLANEADAEELRLKAEEEARRIAVEKEKEELKVKYPYLLKNGEGKEGGYLSTAEVAKNIRLLLKHELPEVKFKVHKESYDCINVMCAREHEDEVEKLAYKFEDHHSDFTGDYWDYDPSTFNHVFGGVRFVFVNRSGALE